MPLNLQYANVFKSIIDDTPNVNEGGGGGH